MNPSISNKIWSCIFVFSTQAGFSFQDDHSKANLSPAYDTKLGFAGFMKRVEGRYARIAKLNYNSGRPLNVGANSLETFGFTDIYIANGQLRSREWFCHANFKDDLRLKQVHVDDAEMQQIKSQPEDLLILKNDGQFTITRPESAFLIGAVFEDELYEPFIANSYDLRVRLSKIDRKPGIEARVFVFGVPLSRVRIARREVFSYRAIWQEDGSFLGNIDATSEQIVLSSEPQLRSHLTPGSIMVANSNTSTVTLIPSPPESICSFFKETSQSIAKQQQK